MEYAVAVDDSGKVVMFYQNKAYMYDAGGEPCGYTFAEQFVAPEATVDKVEPFMRMVPDAPLWIVNDVLARAGA